ncbi:MAG: DMT family transporter [Myxococcales bacterium]
MKRREALQLLIVPAIWGFGFVATRRTLADMGPLWSNAVRFALATLLLYPFARPRLGQLGRRKALHGLGLGLLLFLVFSLQTAGLVTTSVSRSSFLTGLYAVMTPLLGVAFGRPLRPAHAVAAALALAGLWLLAAPASGPLALNRGDLLTLGCAAACALQILVADRVAAGADALALNFWQMVGVAAASLLAAPLLEGFRLPPPSVGFLLAMGYLIVFSSLVAFTLQLQAQKTLPPTPAAMLFLLEAPFGALAGFLLTGDRLAPLQLAGCALMLGASALAVQAGGPAPHPQAAPVP